MPPVLGLGEIRWIHIVQEGEREAQFRDLTCVLINIHAENVSCEQPVELGWAEFPPDGLAPALNELAVALHQKRARPTGGVEDSHARLQRQVCVQPVEHEIHQRERCVVSGTGFAFALAGRARQGVEKLFVDDRQRLYGDKREIVKTEQRELGVCRLLAVENGHYLPQCFCTNFVNVRCGQRKDCAIEPCVYPADQVSECCELGVLAEYLRRYDLPLGKPLVRQDLAVAQVMQVDELADEGVRKSGLRDAIIAQPLFKLPQVRQKRPIYSGLRGYRISEFVPYRPGVDGFRLQRRCDLAEILNWAQPVVIGAWPAVILESGIETHPCGADHEDEGDSILVPYPSVNFSRLGLGAGVADINNRDAAAGFFTGGAVQHVGTLKTAFCLRLAEDMSEVAVRLQSIAHQKIGRITIMECL